MLSKFLICILLSIFLGLVVPYYENCLYEDRTEKPEIFWINLERSHDRGMRMQQTINQVKLKGVRIRGIDANKDEIYLPPDIEKTWPGAWCIKDLPITDENNPPNGTRVVMTGLCGRARKGVKGNTFGELGCTSSHLLAIREAVNRNSSTGIALISEDDIIFPFDIDFISLAASAPKDYGILQLFNSNPSSMKETWRRYSKSHDALWIESHPNKKMDFWSTCIYLINLNVMRDVIDGMAAYDSNGVLNMKVLTQISCTHSDLTVISNYRKDRFSLVLLLLVYRMLAATVQSSTTNLLAFTVDF
jgi:GR25 family glycosyltransferase involved in LPS biosynthesis